MTGPRKRHFWGIRAKLTVCFIGLMVIVTTLIDVAVFQIYRRDIEEKEMASMQAGSEILSDNIRNLISGIEQNLMSEINRSAVFAYLTGGYEPWAASVERKLKGLGTLMHFQGLECGNILVFDCNDHVFYCDYGWTGVGLSQFRQRTVYQEIVAKQERLFPARGCTLWRCYPDAPDEICIIKSYIDPVSLQDCGIVCLTIDREHLGTLLGEYNFDIRIEEEEGGPLYGSRKTTWTVGEDSGDYLISATEIYRRRGNWRLISLIAKEEAFRDLSALMRMLIFAELLLGLVIVFIVRAISDGFLRNVTALAENFRRIHASQEVEKIQPHSHDETAYLCEEFDAMYSQLQENARQMISTNTLLAKAEYSALLAQMNPHFLYNSLETISAMAKLEKQDEIVRVIRMLSHLLRGSLSDGVQETTLAKELDYISCYLELQRMITGGRMTWDIEVDRELYECMVPRLILQPIVENSILHGLDDMLDDAIVIITADVREGRLVLTVSDNGKGAKQEVLDALLSDEYLETDEESHAHIGIRSVLKRIHILYGADYGMTMESEPGNGMTVRVFLPYVEKKHEENIDRR